MKLIQQLQTNKIVSTAIQKTYENVKFNNGFVCFMESLVINNLISPDYKRIKSENGIQWDNQLLASGIIFETSHNPLIANEKTPIAITITGDKYAIENFEYLLTLNNVIMESDEEKDDPWTDIGYTKTSTKRQGSTPPRTRINLNVPYSQKDTAKKMGAKWDAGIRKFYMMVTNEDLKKIPNAWR